MIDFKIENNAVEKLSRECNVARSFAYAAMKNAINQTARQARSIISKQAAEATTGKVRRLNKEMKLKNATPRTMTAIITVTGEPTELMDYQVNPKAPGYNPNGVTTAKVYKKSVEKMVAKKGIKAFVVQFSNNKKGHVYKTGKRKGQVKKTGHISVAVRESKKRFKIHKLFSVSLPQIVGNEKNVYGVVEPEINKLLAKNAAAQVQRLLARMR